MRVLKLIAILGIVFILGACAEMKVEPGIGGGGGINLDTIDPKGGGTGIDDGIPTTICALVEAYKNLDAGAKVERTKSLLGVSGAKEAIFIITSAQQQISNAMCPLFAELLNSDSPLKSEVYCLLSNNPVLITLVMYCCRAYDVGVSSYSDLSQGAVERGEIVKEFEYNVEREIVSLISADPVDSLSAIVCFIVSGLDSCPPFKDFCEANKEPLDDEKGLEPLEPKG